MKKILGSLLAIALVGTAVPAFGDDLNKAVKDAENWTKKAADDTAKATTKAADDAAKWTKKAADDTGKATTKAADDTASWTKKAADDTADAAKKAVK